MMMACSLKRHFKLVALFIRY